MKKLLCHLSAIIAGLFIFCSCSLPNISIQIGYDNETTFADLTELPETQTPDTRPAATTGAPETQTPVTRPAATTGAPETQTPVLPIETECTHTFDIVDGRCNGRCLNCDYLIPSIASFYDISELVIHNGKVLDSGSKHKILIYKNDTYTSYLAYDKQKKNLQLLHLMLTAMCRCLSRSTPFTTALLRPAVKQTAR